MVYKRLVDLQYICVREATEKQCGILVRVLGKTKAESIMFVSGQPFCYDDEFLLFEGQVFSSYSFPTVGELTEVLDIIHSNPSLFSQFEAASMPFDPNSLFWVKDTAISLPFTKKPRCYDASTNRLCKAPKDSEPYRLTMAYFNTKQELVESDIVERPIVEKPKVEKPEVERPNVEKPESKSRMRGVILFICVIILLVGAFLAGKYVNSPNADNSGNIEQDSVKKPVVDSKQDSVKKSAVDSKQDSVKKSAAEEIVSSEKNDATPQKKDTISQPEKKDTLLTTDQYEAMDNRVRTGAYRIIGTDRIVTVKPNDNMTRISNRTLGPGMECYIEVYNGIKPGTPLEPGQKIKIPKVESKKKKPKTK